MAGKLNEKEYTLITDRDILCITDNTINIINVGDLLNVREVVTGTEPEEAMIDIGNYILKNYEEIIALDIVMTIPYDNSKLGVTLEGSLFLGDEQAYVLRYIKSANSKYEEKKLDLEFRGIYLDASIQRLAGAGKIISSTDGRSFIYRGTLYYYTGVTGSSMCIYSTDFTDHDEMYNKIHMFAVLPNGSFVIVYRLNNKFWLSKTFVQSGFNHKQAEYIISKTKDRKLLKLFSNQRKLVKAFNKTIKK